MQARCPCRNVRLSQELLALLRLCPAPLRDRLCMRARHEVLRQGQAQTCGYSGCEQRAVDGLQRLPLLLLVLARRQWGFLR